MSWNLSLNLLACPVPGGASVEAGSVKVTGQGEGCRNLNREREREIYIYIKSPFVKIAAQLV